MNRPLKLTCVGDGAVGKTSFLVTYTTHVFPTEYVPTVFDNYADTVKVDGNVYNVSLWDTAGQEAYERLRLLSYPNTDVFLVCYSVDSRTSFNNILTQWIPEVRHQCPTAPIVLAGLKVDVRGSEDDKKMVSRGEGVKRSKQIGAVKFVECSAKSGEKLDEVIVECVRAGIGKSTARKNRCIFL